MQIFIQLFKRRFRKRRYWTPLAIWGIWFARGFVEQFIFGTLFRFIGLDGDRLLDYFATHPQVAFFILLGASISAILIWMYIDARRYFKSNYLVDTLTEMHKRMIQLKDIRLSSGANKRRMELALPILMDRLDLIELGKWDDFKKGIIKRAQRGVQHSSNIFFKVLSVAIKTARDLTGSRQWAIEDADKVAKWLDDQHMGLAELRSADKHWNTLYESIRPFTLDDRLRVLINKHISLSYDVCAVLLISGYSAKWPNSPWLRFAYTTLVGSPISSVRIDLALSEILGNINKRMEILRRGRRQSRF